MPQTWFSPYPRISRGGNEALEELANLDRDISHLKSIVRAYFSCNSPLQHLIHFQVSDLKEKRQKARDSKPEIPTTDAGYEPKSELHSDYLTIIENQRRAENEVRAVHSTWYTDTRQNYPVA